MVVGGVDRLCGCVPCLRYPRKGNTPRVYYYIIIILLFDLHVIIIKICIMNSISNYFS